MINKSIKNKVLPLKAAIIKMDGDEKIIKASNFNFGNKYIDVVAKGAKKFHNVQKYFLMHNRITGKGAESVMKSISE